MNEILTALNISAADWAATPAVVQDRLRALLVLGNQHQLSQAIERQLQIDARTADLELRMNLHKQNSSRPTSSAPPRTLPRLQDA
jgi:hypothetical protein